MTTATLELSPNVSEYFELRPLQPNIGAELLGIDLRNPLTDGARDAIKAAILKYKVVFFRDQDVSADQHEIFASRFGPLYTHPSSRAPNNKIASVSARPSVSVQRWPSVSRTRKPASTASSRVMNDRSRVTARMAGRRG